MHGELCVDPKWILLRKPKVSPTACGSSGGAQDVTCSFGEHQQQKQDHTLSDMLGSPISEMTCPFFLPIPWHMTLSFHSIVQYLPNKRCWIEEKEHIIFVQDIWQVFCLILRNHIVLNKPSVGPPSPSNHRAVSKSTWTSKKENLVYSPKEKVLLKKK